MSRKKEYIKKYGEVAWARLLIRNRRWQEANPETVAESKRQWNKRNSKKVAEDFREWQEANPEKMEENAHNQNRKGGKHYEKTLGYNRTGLRNERNKIRMKHRNNWREFKKIIAPNSQIHHQWLPETTNYKGVALVEADQHRYGNIDVIQILNGEITLLTEKEIRQQERVR